MTEYGALRLTRRVLPLIGCAPQHQLPTFVVVSYKANPLHLLLSLDVKRLDDFIRSGLSRRSIRYSFIVWYLGKSSLMVEENCDRSESPVAKGRSS